MIVRQFLQWIRTAPAGERADATRALARAYLYSDLSHDDRLAAEGAMVMLLDDGSPLVRLALAESLADSAIAPPTLILALAADQPEVASAVLERSPLLADSDLVDIVGIGDSTAQAAVARRPGLAAAVAGAIAEVGTAEACLTLIENPLAEIVPLSLERIVARHGHLAAIREALLSREDLPSPIRQAVVVKLSETLAGFVAGRAWIEESRARRIAAEACEKATVALAGSFEGPEARSFIMHLRESGQLTPALVLRALLSGNILLFEEVLADLSGLPLSRVSAIVHDRRGTAFRALYDKAGMPASAFAAFRVALESLQEMGFAGDATSSTRLKRRMVERVLTRCEQELPGEVEPLLTMLRRYAVEAAREEARLLCDELVAAA